MAGIRPAFRVPPAAPSVDAALRVCDHHRRMATADPISSSRNPLVRRVRDVRDGKEPGLVVAEGIRLVEDALASGVTIETSLVAPRLLRTDRGRALASALARKSRQTRDCADEVLARASALDTHQGVLALVRLPAWREDDFFRGPHPFLLVVAGVRDPGNVGALLRTAEAAGASGLIALRGSAHPMRDKAVRGSAGSFFRLPARADVSVPELLRLAAERRVTLVATDGQRGTPLWDLELGPAPHAFVVGAEARGIPQPILERCDRLLSIPIAAPLESLNVAVAAGIVLFEHRRRLESAR